MAGERFLVTGASGFVGRRLCTELVKRGGVVRAALRGPESSGVAGEPVAIGRIDGQTDWSEALRDVAVIIHLAARVHVMRGAESTASVEEFHRVNVEGARQLARSAAAQGVRRLVYVSSIKVNGEATFDGGKFTETDPPAPRDPYAVSKWQAEQALQGIAAESGLEVVIVRPPLVYGPGVKANFLRMVAVLGKGLPLPLGAVDNRRSLLHVGNLADALIACATHPAAAGQTYLVSDGEDVSTPELLRKLAGEMGCPARLPPVPPGWLRLAGRLTGKAAEVERLLGSLRIDSGKIRHELHWQPPYTLSQGLRETIEWYRRT